MKRTAHIWGVLALAAVGCGSSRPTPDVDAAIERVDAGVAPNDDADGDGIPTARDCDDRASGVGTTDARACAGPCGDGLEHCFEGVWTECEAPRTCLCSAPGETRVAPCGRCGMQSERCGDTGRWEPQTACQMQGECMPGELDDDGNDHCLSRQRVCTETCAWGDWTVFRPEGECRAGEMRNLRYPSCEIRSQTCDTECHWGPESVLEPAGECDSDNCPMGATAGMRFPFPASHACTSDCRRVHCLDDVDGDGYLDDHDCDAMDPSINITLTRNCDGICGPGTQVCDVGPFGSGTARWPECSTSACPPGYVSPLCGTHVFPLAYRCTDTCEAVPCTDE